MAIAVRADPVMFLDLMPSSNHLGAFFRRCCAHLLDALYQSRLENFLRFGFGYGVPEAFMDPAQRVAGESPETYTVRGCEGFNGKKTYRQQA